MKVLVTGASGFIGRHLVERLFDNGHEVRVLMHETEPPRDCLARTEIAVGDVRDPEAMVAAAAGCETIFHLAGKAHALTEVQSDGESYHVINAEGTKYVLEGAVAGGARCFVLFSTVKVMGEGSIRCLDETFDGLPDEPYGRSKLEAEQIMWEIGRRARLHVSCLRFPLVYGPGSNGNLLKMIRAIDRGVFPPLPELNNRRSMVHVSDVVSAALLAADRAAADGKCYIVTDGCNYSTREIYALICLALGKRIPKWHVPLLMLRVLGGVGDVIGRAQGKRCGFDSDVLRKLRGSAWYSSEKISRELGYYPSITFSKALPEIIAWYRKGHA